MKVVVYGEPQTGKTCLRGSRALRGAKVVLQKMQNLISRHYKSIWETCDRKAAFELCNYIRQYPGIDELPFDAYTFDKGWQWRTIFAEDWKEAKNEFLNLVAGWW